MQIPIDALRVVALCDVESFRYDLNCVRISRLEGGTSCRAEATDGRRAAVIEWDDAEHADDGFREWHGEEAYGVLVPRDLVERIAAAAVAVRDAVLIFLDERVPQGRVQVAVVAPNTGERTEFVGYSPGGKFPVLTEIRQPEGSCCRWFDPRIFGSVARLAADVLPGDQAVALAVGPERQVVSMSAVVREGRPAMRFWAAAMPCARGKLGPVDDASGRMPLEFPPPDGPEWEPSRIRGAQ